MKRIPEVFDCWFESGSMPYAQRHFIGIPMSSFDPKKGIGFPADFISEGLDQTRGWFYSLHVLAGALFAKPAYKNVSVNGIILAEDGQKMSKRLKNYADPLEVVEKYGSDALRFFLLSSPVVYGESINFSEKGVDEVSKKVIMRLNNIYSFYRLYTKGTKRDLPDFEGYTHALDKFIMYRLSETIRSIEQAMDKCRLDRAFRVLADFVDDFSNIYLQYSRDRFKESAMHREEALSSFHYVLESLAKVAAPFLPFLAESLYAEVKGSTAKESVHLEDWPVLHNKIESYKDVAKEMNIVKNAIEIILAERSAKGIPVRQPLLTARVQKLPKNEEYREIIRARVNIEEVGEDPSLGADGKVWLDTTITEELKAKGMVREFIRGVQEARKKEGYVPGEPVRLTVQAVPEGEDVINKFREEIAKAVGAAEIILGVLDSGHGIQAGEITFIVTLERVQ